MSIWKRIEGAISGKPTASKSGMKGDNLFSLDTLEPLEYELNAAGRISLSFVQKIVAKSDREVFCQYFSVPALIGSSLHEGRISEPATPKTARRKTQLFIPKEIIEAANTQSESLQQAIYPLIQSQQKLKSDTPDILTIGRDTECDIVMPDSAISERHARVYIQNKRYTLQDTYSTNGTAVNGVPIQNEATPLVDGCSVQFARYEFKFLSPAALYDFLK